MPAPKGNKNNFKHGFYSARFTRDEKSKLTSSKDDDLESEIKALRVIINRMFSRLNQAGLKPTKPGNIDDQTLKTLNTLINAMASISTLARSHQLITGKYTPVETAILDALMELNAKDGI